MSNRLQVEDALTMVSGKESVEKREVDPKTRKKKKVKEYFWNHIAEKVQFDRIRGLLDKSYGFN
jgi:hypothetical protein